ncbi:MAG: SDR family NAD(P)-dependent oxidoreductase [Kiritimatiellia bacterium]
MKTFSIDFSNKTAVVTGAASGMGLVASRSLVEAGARVVMCDMDREPLDKAVEGLRAVGGDVVACQTDVRQFADAEKAAALALERYGAIDLLIPFAGGNEARVRNSRVPFYEQPIEVIDWGLDVNLKGAVYFARACMPAMIRQGSGVIVCIGSVTGFSGDGSGSMYGTAKSGLFNFVKGLAIAGGKHGVRAFCVSPGPVLTRPEMAAMPTQVGRAASPQEIVDCILFCASDYGAFIDGANLLIDGGQLCC